MPQIAGIARHMDDAFFLVVAPHRPIRHSLKDDLLRIVITNLAFYNSLDLIHRPVWVDLIADEISVIFAGRNHRVYLLRKFPLIINLETPAFFIRIPIPFFSDRIIDIDAISTDIVIVAEAPDIGRLINLLDRNVKSDRLLRRR